MKKKLYKKKIFKQNKLSKLFMLMILFLSIGLTTIAQDFNISGIVTDQNGESLPGAKVVIKGTTNGSIADIDGGYIIQNLDAGTFTVVTSFIGYPTIEKTVEIKNSDITLDFSLTENTTDLDEIVVIGYGIQKKKLSTGATSQVKGEELEKLHTTNALQALQGQTSGVNIVSTSGQPGEGLKVTIRGLGTIANSSPLYVVDGVQTGDISYLNNSDIESIDVLKDAASAAIYGSQSANGVVLITTKQGKKGKSQITFDAYYGIQNVANPIQMLNAKEYAQIMNEQHLNSGGSVSALPFDINNLPAYTSSGVANTNWIDEMLVDNAITSNYTFGATGGSENSVFSMSLSYTGQEGVVGGSAYSNYERYGARFNSENSFFNGIVKIGENFNYTQTKKNGIGVGNQYNNSLRSAFNTSPLLPMYDNDGNYFNTASNIEDQDGNTYWNNTESNPYANMAYNNQNISNSNKIIANLYTLIEPIHDLKYRASLNFEYSASDSRSFTPEYELSVYSFSNYTKASQNMSKNNSVSFDQTLSYAKLIGAHSINAMLGMWAQQYKGSWMNALNTDLAFNDFEHSWLSNATNKDGAFMEITGAPNQNSMLSYFGRIQYDYNETYMLNATFRADGSSRFTDKNKWGYFPSFSVGWVISNESFIENLGSLEFLKLRASWGQVGNQSISNFQYLAPIKFTQATYNFGTLEGINTNGSYPSRLSNEDLRWETSEQTNIGLDARLFNSQLSITADWYKKTTKDWLIIAPVPATAGTDAPYINGGNVTNSGFELGINYNKKINDISYNVGVNASYNKNNVTDIPTEDGIIHGATNTLYNNSTEFYRAETGHAIGYFWGYETDGLFQNTTEVSSYKNDAGTVIQPNAKPGDVRYVDQNGDGKINNDDKIDLGDPNPDFVFGLNFSINYKAFDFSLMANGVAGNQLVQSYRSQSDKYANYTTAILDRWQGEGTSTTIPRVTNQNINYQFSDLFVQKGDYIRLSNISIGVDLAKFISLKNLSQLRIYVTGQNVYTITGYTGMDPEVGFGLNNGDTDQFSSGIDLGYYPRPRTILFGLSLKL